MHFELLFVVLLCSTFCVGITKFYLCKSSCVEYICSLTNPTAINNATYITLHRIIRITLLWYVRAEGVGFWRHIHVVILL